MNEQLLHDRATRNMPLNEVEQTALETWYAARDAEEAALLEQHAAPSFALATLQTEVTVLRRQVQYIERQIVQTESENARITQENAALRLRLSADVSPLEGSFT